MSAEVGEIFKPGQRCPESGVYRVTHGDAHQPDHDVICLFGDPFPPCHQCGAEARFELIQLAPHLLVHKQFKQKPIYTRLPTFDQAEG